MQGWTDPATRMDETTFRDLLARHWTTLFDPHTIEKGADYLRRGYVLGTHYEAGDGEGALIGMVEGTARDPSAALGCEKRREAWATGRHAVSRERDLIIARRAA